MYKQEVMDAVNKRDIYKYKNRYGESMYGLVKGDIFVGMKKDGTILTGFKPNPNIYASVEDYLRRSQRNVELILKRGEKEK